MMFEDRNQMLHQVSLGLPRTFGPTPKDTLSGNLLCSSKPILVQQEPVNCVCKLTHHVDPCCFCRQRGKERLTDGIIVQDVFIGASCNSAPVPQSFYCLLDRGWG